MENKERVNVKSLYDWTVDTIESYRERYGSLIFQTDWIPVPDYFFKHKNDKIFSSAIQMSYDDEYFCFGILTQEYLEPIAGCSLKNVMDNDEVFQKELGHMLESLLNRQEDRKEKSSFVIDIKESIEKIIKGDNSYFPYDIKDYSSYSKKQERELLKNVFTFESFNTNKRSYKILKDVNKGINQNIDEIYKQKYEELSNLFYSPNIEKYPLQEVINPGNLKIKKDSLKKGSNLVINNIEYIIDEDVIFKNHKEDFIETSSGKEIDVKISHKGEVYLKRNSDNNFYSMDIYIIEEKDKKGNNIYYLDEIVEEQLYIHDVTYNLPEDNRPLVIDSCFLDSKVKEMYKDYNIEKAYKREDFKDYLKEISSSSNIKDEVLNAFKNEFKNNKELLLNDNFDIREWSDNVINMKYGINLSPIKLNLSRRKKM